MREPERRAVGVDGRADGRDARLAGAGPAGSLADEATGGDAARGGRGRRLRGGASGRRCRVEDRVVAGALACARRPRRRGGGGLRGGGLLGGDAGVLGGLPRGLGVDGGLLGRGDAGDERAQGHQADAGRGRGRRSRRRWRPAGRPRGPSPALGTAASVAFAWSTVDCGRGCCRRAAGRVGGGRDGLLGGLLDDGVAVRRERRLVDAHAARRGPASAAARAFWSAAYTAPPAATASAMAAAMPTQTDRRTATDRAAVGSAGGSTRRLGGGVLVRDVDDRRRGRADRPTVAGSARGRAASWCP